MMDVKAGDILYLTHQQPHTLVLCEITGHWLLMLLQSPGQRFKPTYSYVITDYLQWEVLYQLQLVAKDQVLASQAVKVDELSPQMVQNLIADPLTKGIALRLAQQLAT